MKTISVAEGRDKIVAEAVAVLADGGLIIYPTETCYGVGVDATNLKAVEKVLRYKGDRKHKPISIAVSGLKMAEEYTEINPTAINVFNNLLPGPITVICRGKHKVDNRIESETGTLGLRYPAYPLVVEIVKEFGRPITSTSANVSGGSPPYEIESLFANLSEQKKTLIDLVIDGGELPKRPPSVVLDTVADQPEVLRQGQINFDRLGVSVVVTSSAEETQSLGQKILADKKHLLADKSLFFILQGELGAGKTQFAKGLGKALGIKENITSPTFNLVKEYKYSLGNKSGVFYHVDAWRISQPEELLDLGIKKMLAVGNVVAIEWAEKSGGLWRGINKNTPAQIIAISLEYIDEKRRRVKFA